MIRISVRMLCATVAGLFAYLLSFTTQAEQEQHPQSNQDQFPLPLKTWPRPVMDQQTFAFLLIDRLEYRWQSGADLRVWDIQGWVGGDYNKLWLKSEGEDVAGGRTEQAEIEALYARLVAPFWYLQAGLREDMRPTPSRTSLVLGVQGLAPYWFDVEAATYLNQKGKLSVRFEAEYDVLLTQRLILQPRFDTAIAASSDRERGVGQGFNSVELGLRLRYEFRRQFAPYIGVTWSRKLGETADFARTEKQDVSETAVVAGVRVWF